MNTNLVVHQPLLSDSNLRELLQKAKYDLIDVDKAVKWKAYDNQLVLSGDRYYYKLYRKDRGSGYFFCKIREKLGEIYRNNFGIEWDVNTCVVDNMIYQIERREKLEVTDPLKITFCEIMQRWSRTLTKLERSLHLHEIVWSLPSELNIRTIKLMRDCVNDFGDYALTKNGDVVLLDDTDWFLAPIDKNGQWKRLQYSSYDCELDGEMYSFVPSNWSLYGNIAFELRKNERHNMWTLAKDIDHMKTDHDDIFSSREQMFNDNLSVLINPDTVKNLIAVDEDKISRNNRFYCIK